MQTPWDRSRHQFAPALKFIEYAALGYYILASDTVGLRLQAKRSNYKNAVFAKEDVEKWAQAIETHLLHKNTKAQGWYEKEAWSYPALFRNQYVKSYKEILL